MTQRAPSAENLFWGLLLILIGALALAPAFGIQIAVNLAMLWPLFLIVPGLGFWISFLTNSDRKEVIGLVIPATILTLLGAFFTFSLFTGWKFTGELSFVFPLIVGLSFWAAWGLGNHEIGFLIPAVILTVIAAVVFTTVNLMKLFIPFALIGLGIYMLIQKDTNAPHQVKEEKQIKQEKSASQKKSVDK
ncbi:MAG TPA: DUF5668 domain-containing protein [bacterium]|nr:DUF5668 domain-containing protein [bacterium]